MHNRLHKSDAQAHASPLGIGESNNCGKRVLPERAFLLLAILLGVVFIFVTPPFEVPDEGAHFYRSYQVSVGRLLPQENGEGGVYRGGGILPESIIYTCHTATGGVPFHPEVKVDMEKNILPLFDVRLDPKKKAFIAFPNTASYPFVPYIPQAVGIALGRIIGLSPLSLMYLGRLTNLIVWIFLIYLSIRITPIGKWVLFLAALTPMSLFMGASLSGDAATNGLTFLFIALMMRYGLDKGPELRPREKAMVFALTIMLALCRTPYFLVVFLFFIVPVEKFESSRNYWTFCGALVVSALVINVGWLVMNGVSMTSYLLKGDVSPHDQFLFIVGNPFQYIEIMARTLWQHRLSFFISHFGVLGWLDTLLPLNLLYMYAAVLMLTALVDGNGSIGLTLLQRGIIGVIFLAFTAAVFTAIYLTWTQVRAPIIEGIQGRYFIAFSPLFYLLFYNRLIARSFGGRVGVWHEWAVGGVTVWLPLFVAGSLGIALRVMVRRYYI